MACALANVRRCQVHDARAEATRGAAEPVPWPAGSGAARGPNRDHVGPREVVTLVEQGLAATVASAYAKQSP